MLKNEVMKSVIETMHQMDVIDQQSLGGVEIKPMV
jgi:hypothetical protein